MDVADTASAREHCMSLAKSKTTGASGDGGGGDLENLDALAKLRSAAMVNEAKAGRQEAADVVVAALEKLSGEVKGMDEALSQAVDEERKSFKGQFDAIMKQYDEKMKAAAKVVTKAGQVDFKSELTALGKNASKLINEGRSKVKGLQKQASSLQSGPTPKKRKKDEPDDTEQLSAFGRKVQELAKGRGLLDSRNLVDARSGIAAAAADLGEDFAKGLLEKMHMKRAVNLALNSMAKGEGRTDCIANFPADSMADKVKKAVGEKTMEVQSWAPSDIFAKHAVTGDLVKLFAVQISAAKVDTLAPSCPSFVSLAPSGFQPSDHFG